MSYNQLSLKEKIGQLFMFGFRGTGISEDTRQLFENNNIGFAILFSRNIETISQVKELTRNIHSLGKIPPFIYTDQEGGTVVQFKELRATVISPMGLAATGTPRSARKAGQIIGTEMKDLGVDGVLAPSLDVNYEENNPIIGIRSFSDDPEIVAQYGMEFAVGLSEKGVACCLKHYPGHGGATVDSHLDIPVVNISPEYFNHYCLDPFSRAVRTLRSGIDAIMTAHIIFPALSPHIATFCPYFINDLLRKKMHYKGIIMSDCLEMNAVKEHFSPETMVKNAMDTGLDLMIVSHSPDFQKELLDALYFQVKKGIIPEKRIDQSLLRILKLRKKYLPLAFSSSTYSSRNLRALRASYASHTSDTSHTSYGAEDEGLRMHWGEEEKIADKSITVLRNRKNIIPIRLWAKTLIIEWGKVQATMPVSSAAKVSYLDQTAKEYLEHVDIEVLDLPTINTGNAETGIPSKSIPTDLRDRVSGYDYIIAAVYSRSPNLERLQAEAIKDLLSLRSDLIVVALGNPYDIRHFPLVDTYVVTYGFREVQVQTLFSVLTGFTKPAGKLPVQIQNMFPRWSACPQLIRTFS